MEVIKVRITEEIYKYGCVKNLLSAHDGSAPIQAPNTTMKLQAIVQNLKVDRLSLVRKRKETLEPCC